MKRVLFILLAALMVLGTTQCKKKVEKFGPFKVHLSLQGGNDKSISPLGHVAWQTGDKVYAWGEGMDVDAGDELIVLEWVSGDEFVTEEAVPNGSYNFFYFGHTFTLTGGNCDSGCGEVYIDAFGNQTEGTLEDISNRMHVRAAKDVQVVGGQANAVMENQIAIGYFDISAFTESNNYENYISGSQLYTMLTVDYITGECTSDNPGDIKIPDGGLVYLAFVPSEKTTLTFHGGRFDWENVTSDVAVQVKVEGNPYTYFEPNNFYTAENYTPIRVASCMPTSVVLANVVPDDEDCYFTAHIYTTGTEDFPEWLSTAQYAGFDTYVEYDTDINFSHPQTLNDPPTYPGDLLFPTEDDPFDIYFNVPDAGHTYYVRAAVSVDNHIEQYHLYSEVMEIYSTARPTLSTLPATNVTRNMATVGGNVTSQGGSTVTTRGVEWGTESGHYTHDDDVIGFGSGVFTVNLLNLDYNTTYYYRAYAINSVGKSYGEEMYFTTVDAAPPTVVTYAPNSMTYTTARLEGRVEYSNGADVTERGFCWSTSSTPTVSGSHVSVGSGLGTFYHTLTGLTPGTRYYVRAYARNAAGLNYGEVKSFSTSNYQLPTVETTEVVDVWQYSARVKGIVTDNGGASITERGVCWSTSSNPTISDHHLIDVSNGTNIEINITKFDPGTHYYVCAYAKNSVGVSYGAQLEFTTPVYYFSVSSSKKVIISKGNLQYKASADTWRFAEHQYDMIGAANANIGPNYSGWIDLFNYGTGDAPTYYGEWNNNYLTDWGENVIGTYPAFTWRTLKGDEMRWMMTERANADQKYGKATVCNVRGLVILPDNWTLPAGLVAFNPTGDWTSNYYTEDAWAKMEGAGAVFLPAAGYRESRTISQTGNELHYWTLYTYEYWNGVAYEIRARKLKYPNGSNFGDYATLYEPYTGTRSSIAFSVRLVKDY